jgi:DNA-binding MarR family transcriptional regulator
VSTDRRHDALDAEEALRRIVRSLRVSARQIEGAAPISAAQAFVLQQLATMPGMSLRELAERTMTDRTSVASMLERLTAQGYVTIERSAADRRRSEIVLTRAGRSVLARAPKSPTAHLLDAMRRLDRKELHALTVGLRRLAEEMGVASGPAPLLFADTREGAREPKGRIGRSR